MCVIISSFTDTPLARTAAGTGAVVTLTCTLPDTMRRRLTGRACGGQAARCTIAAQSTELAVSTTMVLCEGLLSARLRRSLMKPVNVFN